VLVDKINDGSKDAESFAISNLTIAQRDWFKDADLLMNTCRAYSSLSNETSVGLNMCQL